MQISKRIQQTQRYAVSSNIYNIHGYTHNTILGVLNVVVCVQCTMYESHYYYLRLPAVHACIDLYTKKWNVSK